MVVVEGEVGRSALFHKDIQEPRLMVSIHNMWLPRSSWALASGQLMGEERK